MSKIVLLKYNAGNTQSVIYALNRLGIEPVLTDNVDEIKSADKIIFPGVGEAASAMNYLKERNLDKVIIDLKQPFLGICLGLQLMCNHSEENNTDCLGIFDVNIKKFDSVNVQGERFKVPEMGWNSLENLKSPLMDTIKEGEFVYFVHSYYAELNDFAIATTSYNVQFASAIAKDNFYAVQFHPEKSAKTGEIIIRNFLEKI